MRCWGLEGNEIMFAQEKGFSMVRRNRVSFVCRYLAYSIIKYVLGLDCIQVSFTVVHHVIDSFSMQ
jgi:hypothetical protein